MVLALARVMTFGVRPLESKRAVGFRFEKLAEEHLLGLGWRLLARNFTVRGGELDLVFEETAASGVFLVFVEVRMRRERGLDPRETMNPLKIRRLHRAGAVFLMKYRGRAKGVRFDLVGIHGGELRHFRDFIGNPK